MTMVTDLDLPVFDYTAPGFPADRYHVQLAGAGAQGWIYGIEALPLCWDAG
jgi:hypothetical protein